MMISLLKIVWGKINTPISMFMFLLAMMHISVHVPRIVAFTIPLSSFRQPTGSAYKNTCEESSFPSCSYSTCSSHLSLARGGRENDRDRGRYGYREVGQSSAERELSQMEYEEDVGYEYEYEYEDEDDYDYEDDNFDDDDKNDDPRDRGRPRFDQEKDTDNSGNFWSNNRGGIEMDSPRPRARNAEPRAREIRSSSNIPRERGSNRKTFRSGNPPPPAILKDFYDKVFWYGFDSKDTTSSADKTMFGGTRGKFSGLGLLEDGESDISRERSKSRRRRMDKRFQYEDEDEDDYDDDYEDDEDDDEDDTNYESDEEYAYYEDDELWEDEKYSAPFEKKQGDLRRREMSSLPPKDDDLTYKAEIAKEGGRIPPVPRPRRSPERRARTRAKKSTPSTNKRAKTSTWFADNDDNDYFDDDAEEGRRRRGRGRGDEDSRSQTSPIINILDKVFQVDPDEVKFQADDYNRRLGLDRKKGARGRGRESWKEARAGPKPRKGYAYRYNRDEEEDMSSDTFDSGFDDSANMDITSGSKISTSSNNNDDDVIDVEVKLQPDSPQKGKIEEGRKPKQQSWEDRAAAYERVPPKEVKAWGPNGEIDGGIDARTYAANCAIEEIENMRSNFEKKEVAVIEAQQNLLELKREASIQKRNLLLVDDRRKSTSIRDELRKTNFEIEDSARMLRKAKNEAIAAIDRLESTELYHWALLRQYEADQEMENTEVAQDSI